MMSSDDVVVEASKAFLPWLVLMPVVGCAAFTWDGIFIGATGSKEMRNSMLWSVVAFAAVWIAGVIVLNLSMPASYGIAAMHILMGAYFAHLLARTVYLTVKSPLVYDCVKQS